MPLYQQENSSLWYVDIRLPNGKRLRRSSGTTIKAQAQEYHDCLKAQLWRNQTLGDKLERTFDEAALKWIKEKSHKRSLRDDKHIIQWWRTQLTMPLHEVRGSIALELVLELKVSNARKNKYLAVLRAILRRAERVWEWIDKAPAFTLLPIPNRRIRSLTKEKAQLLIKELPDHQRLIVLFALATGLRQGNVLGMTWEKVDLERRIAWVEAEDFKNGNDHSIPLNDTALAVLRQCIGKHKEFIFTYRGKQIKQANTKAWRNALQRADIKSFRWHDLRHVAASWMVQSGAPLFAVQEFFGWESQAMVRRYAHLAPEHLAVHAGTLDAMLGHSLVIP
ncbi:tyrosine-type recombinase/integrase [Chitinimonas sp. BJB300]|uniref:tyrosine-type recombinase/integrase n=1 Tax=Chitinimonas sp. BJB300 TaxID=1559339 RepID=UPI000C113366|nr:site-specific integrase [Chitinimonas sp. BJB300]PHV12072.1 integrase [Chitinimonas sp. BJB300]TSJ87323.1 site-specific integrase [Chitinimonas sp. BJB300]